MKVTFDSRYNVAYIRFSERRAEVETIRLSDELNVDIGPDGTVYGIELLNANEQLGGEDDASIVIVSEATGRRHEVRLAE